MVRHARRSKSPGPPLLLARALVTCLGQLGRRPARVVPAAEPLETRRLLSGYSGASANLPFQTPAGLFLVQVQGGGAVEVHHLAGGAIDLDAYGTTSNSTITITQTQPRYHAASQLLLIRNLRIRSGQLGSLDATPAELDGRMTSLSSSVDSIQLGTIGPKAQVSVNGSVGSLSVANIDLGPSGQVAISGDINSLQQSGPMTVGAITIDGGRFAVGRDSLDSITINGDVDISEDGVLSIGRDQDGTFTVNGSVTLSSGGQIQIGRNLADMDINGNLIVQPSGSGIAIDGALESLSIEGYFEGQGGTNAASAIDLGVGLDLSGLTIQGGISGQGGLINANVRAGGAVSGLNIVYGTYNSTIQSNATMTS